MKPGAYAHTGISTGSDRVATRRRTAPPSISLSAFVIAFAILIGFSRFALHKGWWNDREIAAVHATIPSGDDYYLANFHAGIEHMVFYHGFSGVPGQLKKADVLFLGDSHMQFDWPRQTLQPFFAKRHMTYYMMAFGYHETSAFPLELIKKYDLHPRYVVINVDPFFHPNPSIMAKQTMHDTRFQAFKFRLETIGSFYAQRWIHTFVPGLTGQVVSGDEIYYRSKSDGTIELAAGVDMRSPVPAEPAGAVNWYTVPVPEAIKFHDELKRRGATLIFTKGPMSSPLNVTGIADCLGAKPVSDRPPVLMVPFMPGLTTFDGAHLDKPSAIRFSDAFLKLLGDYLDGNPRR